MSATFADARQVERGLAGLVESFRRVARRSDLGWIEERDHLVSVATGVPLAPFNPTFVLRPPRDPAGAFERVRDFYARTSVAGEVNAWGDTAHAVAAAARSGGLVAGHRIPCLLLAPLGVRLPAVPGLQVRRVDDAAALLWFNDICAPVFGIDRQALAVFDSLSVLEVPGFGFHLGLVDGVPVATAMSCCIDGVVLIFNVATLPSHRRRGIGETMTWSALHHGIEFGCDLAFLQTSTEGRPLYERMGFQHAVDLQTWSLSSQTSTTKPTA